MQQVLAQHAVHRLSAQVLVQNWRPPSGHIKERQIKDPDVSFLTRRLFFSQRLWRTNEGDLTLAKGPLDAQERFQFIQVQLFFIAVQFTSRRSSVCVSMFSLEFNLRLDTTHLSSRCVLGYAPLLLSADDRSSDYAMNWELH